MLYNWLHVYVCHVETLILISSCYGYSIILKYTNFVLVTHSTPILKIFMNPMCFCKIQLFTFHLLLTILIKDSFFRALKSKNISCGTCEQFQNIILVPIVPSNSILSNCVLNFRFKLTCLV